MNDKHEAPSQARKHSSSDFSDADRLRALLDRAGLSQRAAAKLLNIDERAMRQWCAGQGKPPASVFRALSPRLTHTENLRRMIESNENTLEALRAGRITGMGYGPGPSDPQSVQIEIRRLLQENEEHRAMVRWEEAFHRIQDAHFELNGQWLPHGNGIPAEQSLSAFDIAEKEFRAAQAEVDRITQEIHAGKR